MLGWMLESKARPAVALTRGPPGGSADAILVSQRFPCSSRGFLRPSGPLPQIQLNFGLTGLAEGLVKG